MVEVPLQHENGAFTTTSTDLVFTCLDTLRTASDKQRVNDAGGALNAGLQQCPRRAEHMQMGVCAHLCWRGVAAKAQTAAFRS